MVAGTGNLKPQGEPTMASPKNSKSSKARAAKTTRKASPQASATPSKLSALDAAARVLAEAKEPLSCPELIEQMAAKGYWTSPAGKTPASTLYTAVRMLPKMAPSGATIKRARIDPVGDSDLRGLDLDAFHQADNDFTTYVPVGVVEPIANLVSKGV